jgi:ATP-binding cassette subfamily B protein
LARAILGLYPLASGSVSFNGLSSDDLSLDVRRGLVGYLPQDSLLFSGTLRENITLNTAPGGMNSDEFLKEVIAIAGLAEDVSGFPQGLDTQVGEAGIRISGGQRQRVGVARALAAAAPTWPGLLVLDDPFSAVDVGTEAAIIAALRQAFGREAPLEHQATIVLCSHRLAGFPHADQVAVLRDGVVEELGTHAELMDGNGLYRRIYLAQRTTEAGVPERAAP